MYISDLIFFNLHKRKKLSFLWALKIFIKITHSSNPVERRRNSYLNYVTLKMAVSWRDMMMLPFEIDPIYTRTQSNWSERRKNRIKLLIFDPLSSISLSGLLEDSDLLNSDVDMADKISIRYSPEYFSSFHYMMVSLMVLVPFEVAFPAFYTLRDDSLS